MWAVVFSLLTEVIFHVIAKYNAVKRQAKGDSGSVNKKSDSGYILNEKANA